MTIYGTAVLAGCVLAGLLVGQLLGTLMGVQANVGGVGLAMLMLIYVTDRLRHAGKMGKATDQGILFWGSIYVPVVVAMAACQNVRGALDGGPTAILAGTSVVVLGFLLVPVLRGDSSAVGPSESETEAR